MANEATKRMNEKKALKRAVWLEESTYYNADGTRDRKVSEHSRFACLASPSDVEIIKDAIEIFDCSVTEKHDFLGKIKDCVLLEFDFGADYLGFLSFGKLLHIRGVSDIGIVSRKENFIGDSELYLEAIKGLVEKFNQNKSLAV